MEFLTFILIYVIIMLYFSKTRSSLTNIAKDVSLWQRRTFPGSGSRSKWLHLAQEIIELEDALLSKKGIPEELADCVILLIGIADMENVNLEKAIKDKMEINKSRVWGEPNEFGVVNHVKSEGE